MTRFANNSYSVRAGLLTPPVFVEKFSEYRKMWAELDSSVSSGHYPEKPLCIDIEVASICDLECPYCFRSSLATPDKIMKFEDCKTLISQVAEWGVPSIKLNWRGEPLMHPKIVEIVSFAKTKGILEVLINTNATHLTESVMANLIDAGLDVLIISMDGADAAVYEKNRPGRFRENKFEAILGNITRAFRVRATMGQRFPYFQIQGVGTNELLAQAELYLNVFGDICDELVINPYSERGLGLSAENELSKSSSEEDGNYPLLEMITWDQKVHRAYKRKPCAQPFQRMLITYDGRVAACCYDWGAMHPIGYTLCDRAELSVNPNIIVKERADRQRPGYGILGDLNMPEDSPLTDVFDKRSLPEIWAGPGSAYLKQSMMAGNISAVEMCRHCDFKDTYVWEKN